MLDDQALDAAAIPAGFARNFLSRARRPRFEYIAPSMRVPTRDEFSAQPFLEGDREETDDGSQSDADSDSGFGRTLPPMLLFRSGVAISLDYLDQLNIYTSSMRKALPVHEVPCGLYMHLCFSDLVTPFEDAIRLVLPFRLDQGWAKRSDLSPTSEHDDLLQAGHNPYNQRHSVKLQAFLDVVLRNIEQGRWSVGAKACLN